MSRYLIERIRGHANIELIFQHRVVALEGTEDGSCSGCDGAAVSRRRIMPLMSGNVFLSSAQIRHRLARRLRRPRSIAEACRHRRAVEQNRAAGGELETSVPGVFAVGDRVRARQRVGGATARARRWCGAARLLGDVAKPAL